MNEAPGTTRHSFARRNLAVPEKPLDLAPFIDHTLLKPESTEAQIVRLCQEAIENRFYAVCVNGAHVHLAGDLLKNSDVKLASVIGFPLGAMASRAKAFEAELAARDGATEIDMVMRVDLAKTGAYGKLADDIRAVVDSVKGAALVKVILETGLLSLDEIAKSSMAADEAGAHFVKTCTGFSTGAATVEHIALMKKSISARMEVKASGGVRSFEQARDLIAAGATRIGTSSGVTLIKGSSPTSGY